MKGLELPVNILVVIAIAVIVLLGMVALFLAGFSPFSMISGQESFKNQACAELTRGGCAVNSNTILVNFDANKDGAVYPGIKWSWTEGEIGFYSGSTSMVQCRQTGTGCDNLAALCYNYYGRKTEAQCKNLCACPGY